jgi:hypothetical protein
VVDFKRIRLGKSILFANRIKYTIVDKEDESIARSMIWYPFQSGNNFYARFQGTALHRLIMKAPKGVVVDHINGNGLDNRKSNLRLVSHSSNERNRHRLNSNNTSGMSGVFRVRGGHWGAQVWLGTSGRRFAIASIPTYDEAVEVRRCAEVLVYGSNAPLRSKAKGTLVGKYASLDELAFAYPRLTPVGRSGVRGVSKSNHLWKAKLPGGKVLGYFRSVALAEQALAEARRGG